MVTKYAICQLGRLRNRLDGDMWNCRSLLRQSGKRNASVRSLLTQSHLSCISSPLTAKISIGNIHMYCDDELQWNCALRQTEKRPILHSWWTWSRHFHSSTSLQWISQFTKRACILIGAVMNIVSSTMSRNRFADVKWYLHLLDDEKADPSDKLHKIRSFITHINERLIQHGIFSRFLSIDEKMVAYFGHHSAKMFIRSKPIRFWYKLWVLASNSGYPYKFSVYCGKIGEQNKFLGYRVLATEWSPRCCQWYPTRCVMKCSLTIFYILWSTSLPQQSGHQAKGAVRENRLKQCVLQDTKLMKKTTRGTYDSKCDGVVGVVKWNGMTIIV